MFINSKVKDLIPVNNLDDIYVVADFDRTITTSNSVSSWDILALSKLAPSAYKKERQELFDYYYPIVESSSDVEYSYKLKKNEEWFRKHINLLIKYKLSEEVFTDATKNLDFMEPRPYVLEFLSFLHEYNIPLIIFSAGVGNFIESFLKCHNCEYDNIYIISNMIKFTNGIAVGVKGEVIHTFNKNEDILPEYVTKVIKNRGTVALIGDHIGDIKMVDPNKHKRVISIGLPTTDASKAVLSSYYDIVCDINENYKDILSILFNKM